MVQAVLTPITDVTPVSVTLPERELSGGHWVQRFPGSNLTTALDEHFRSAVDGFIHALRTAGVKVLIAATFRPPERAYLMHWSWKLARKKINPDQVPPMSGVNIEWNHGDEAASVQAAAAMVAAYGMTELQVAPALRSRHTERKAIDMTISWSGTVTVKDASGNDVKIDTHPRTGMNAKLHAVGASYGVIKFWKGASDKPHWSEDGR